MALSCINAPVSTDGLGGSQAFLHSHPPAVQYNAVLWRGCVVQGWCAGVLAPCCCALQDLQGAGPSQLALSAADLHTLLPHYQPDPIPHASEAPQQLTLLSVCCCRCPGAVQWCVCWTIWRGGGCALQRGCQGASSRTRGLLVSHCMHCLACCRGCCAVCVCTAASQKMCAACHLRASLLEHGQACKR